jgi:serine/threonine-protein kinase HipA
MAQPKSITVAVRLQNRPVGELRYDRGGATFKYADDLAYPDHHVLGQTFEGDPRRTHRERAGLPPWFANLLPEGELRRQIVQELGGGHVRDFTLLMRLGKYLPGAVTVHGDDEPDEDDTGTTYSPPNHPLRHFQAGVQLKYTTTTDRITIPVSGNNGWWTAKLPDRSLRELTTNEYLTMRWLSAASYPVPPVHLPAAAAVGGIPEGMVEPTEPIYLVERFDRSHERRTHFEDFAQILNVAPVFKYGELGGSYDGLAAAIYQLAGEADYLDYIDRLVAMLVVGNTDAHLKNWALIYPDGRTPRLAPVYDFHSLTVYQRYHYTPLALSLNGGKQLTAVGFEDFERLAERVGADPQRTVQRCAAAVERLRQAWSGELRSEAQTRFAALAKHYAHRLGTLKLCTTG